MEHGRHAFKAYFDDSGTTEQAIGGCLASEQSWEELNLAWGVALNDNKLTWFHAKDFEHYSDKGDYAHLSQANRDALFTRLLALVSKHISACACLILPTIGVEVSKQYSERDRSAHRKKRRTEPERKVNDMVRLNYDP